MGIFQYVIATLGAVDWTAIGAVIAGLALYAAILTTSREARQRARASAVQVKGLAFILADLAAALKPLYGRHDDAAERRVAVLAAALDRIDEFRLPDVAALEAYLGAKGATDIVLRQLAEPDSFNPDDVTIAVRACERGLEALTHSLQALGSRLRPSDPEALRAVADSAVGRAALNAWVQMFGDLLAEVNELTAAGRKWDDDGNRELLLYDWVMRVVAAAYRLPHQVTEAAGVHSHIEHLGMRLAAIYAPTKSREPIPSRFGGLFGHHRLLVEALARASAAQPSRPAPTWLTRLAETWGGPRR